MAKSPSLEYRRVNSNAGDATIATRRWLCEARGSVLCGTCGKPIRERFPEPIDIVIDEFARRASYAHVADTGLKIIDAELFSAIERFIGVHISVGRCYFPTGVPDPKYLSYYTSGYLVVRGGPSSKYWKCPRCGSLASSVAPRERYLLHRDCLGELACFDSAGSIFLRSDVAEQVGWERWPDIMLDRVRVREEPIDGRDLPKDAKWE